MSWQALQSVILNSESNLSRLVWAMAAVVSCCYLICSFLNSLFVSIIYLQLSFVSVEAFHIAVNRSVHHRILQTDRERKSENGKLADKHVEAIASRNWKDVLVWVTFCPDELVWVDRKKQTVLLYACLFQAPAHVIELILLQAPELVNIANVDGEIPLHWAMRLGLSNQIIRLLLAASPSSGVFARDNDGNTALSLLWERHQDAILRTWWDGRDRLIASRAWDRIMFFLKCSWYKSVEHPSDANSQILHMAARCPCPPSLFPLILQVHRDQIHQKDINGQTPLAAACSDPLANRFSDVTTKIEMLLNEDNEAMATVQRTDCNGRSPIFCAIASGIAWEEGIKLLFDVDTSVISQYDPVTGLSPFMLAATGSRQREIISSNVWPVDSAATDDTRSLTTIFNLLRADPLQACRSTCNTEM